MGALRRHLTYANVMSSLAVFMVLGGGAYAAAKIPRNSVGTQQIKNRGVRASDLAKGAVSGAAIKDGSLTLDDFKRGELTGGAAGGAGGAGQSGPPGPPGPEGPAGPGAAAGRDGAALVTTFRNTSPSNPTFGSTDQSGSNVPFMVGGSWTQPANALDWFFARVRVSYGTNCRDAGDALKLSLRINNQTVTQPAYATFAYPGTGSSHWFTIPFQVEDAWLIPPEVDTARQFLALAYTTCNQTQTTPVRIEELRVDVVRAVR